MDAAATPDSSGREGLSILPLPSSKQWTKLHTCWELLQMVVKESVQLRVLQYGLWVNGTSLSMLIALGL